MTLYNYKVEFPSVNLYKLHGSMTWKHDSDDIVYQIQNRAPCPPGSDVELLGDCDAVVGELMRRLEWVATTDDDDDGSSSDTSYAFNPPNRYLFRGAVRPSSAPRTRFVELGERTMGMPEEAWNYDD